MDLFDYMKEQTLENESPLASRMRPVTLEEVAGQAYTRFWRKILPIGVEIFQTNQVALTLGKPQAPYYLCG